MLYFTAVFVETSALSPGVFSWNWKRVPVHEEFVLGEQSVVCGVFTTVYAVG